MHDRETQLQCDPVESAPVESEDKRYQGVVASAVMRAMFPKDAARRAFEPFSTAVADLAREEHLHHREDIWIYQCPMSPVLGTARWPSRTHQLRNPFFGPAMLTCGDEVK